MTITAQTIITKARYALADPNAVRWTDAELLAWLKVAVVAVVNVRPDAAVVTADLTLVDGTKQSLPSGATALIDVPRNTGGRAIRKTSATLLDTQRPTWHTDTTGAVKNYIYDPRTPRIFYVYPKATAGDQVEVKYQATPTAMASVSDNVPIDDTYEPVLLDGVLWRAYAKDAEYASSAALAQLHKTTFEGWLEAKTRSDAASVPRESAEA